MKKDIYSLIGFTFLTIIFSLSFFSSEITDSTACVDMFVSDISPSSIGIGEEFTIGIQIENCGSTIPKFVSIELLSPPADITIKEPLVINVSRLYYGNSERFITYHMRTNEDAIPGTHVLKTRLSYGDENAFVVKNSEISFEVIGEKAEIGIASIKTLPVLPYEKDTVELTLRVENVGEGDAKSIMVYIDHPFQGIKQSFIGKLASEEDGPAVFTFITDEPGEFNFPVTISYYDNFGKKEFKSSVDLTVLKRETNVGAIVFTIASILIILAGIFYFIKTRKAKDKIIHQLLRGNPSKERDRK